MKKKKTRPPLNKRKPIIDTSRDRKMLSTKKGAPGTNTRVQRTRPEAPLQNGKELKPIMIKPNMGRVIKPMAKFTDLSGDGEVTKKDILMGRGVINKPKMQNGKTLKELEAEINRIGKDAIKSTNPNERDAALMKKRILMKERDAMIAANKKKSKTNKTNPTMKKPKMYNKPKMDHGKKPKMYNKPKYYGKKKK